MRIVVDTDVASNLIKNTLDPAFRAELAPHEAAITFVTVGELTQWTLLRDLGARRRSELQAYIATRVKIPGGSDVGRKWGGITAYAQRRGRPRPINDSWIAACCLTYDLPLATLNTTDFDDYAQHEGLQLISPFSH
jgi:predicted nucleic acid-binding protein